MKEELVQAKIIDYGKLKSIYNDIFFYKEYSEALRRNGGSLDTPPPSLKKLNFIPNTYRLGPLKVSCNNKILKIDFVNALVESEREGLPKYAIIDFSKGIKIYLAYENERPIIGIDVGIRHLFTVASVNSNGKICKVRYFGDKEIIQPFIRYLGEEQGVVHLTEIKEKVKGLVHQTIRFIESLDPKIVAIEDLRLYDAKVGKGLRVIQEMLEHEFYNKGIKFKRLDPYNTSRICSHCGYKRGEIMGSIFVCPSCGYKADRDFNAAYNLALKCYYTC
ncbi:zinc ribbon domain-containing protein [Acidianus brierleyi]|uniref:Transposase n=1 Tax=Acidianus brierleyi TaxID=41673 RepID=A0A2U9IE41_9CREN|nr:zinc ribbon domain-containing protein [Acidianus brierleyi]AWR94275.1 transposase [Acidianus brierleyi]